ncbi:hypothetical protein G7Y89_g4716 [Cudoniella acicularis]|uniref:F-box domain-containing protein n=1 Tax=Cudoniella acicularis TaxID=354080 RepID=A0A8H4RNV8_9HELO|nr:hypothetical protein G7Y89_g4716 [Cudoniella acicularis]
MPALPNKSNRRKAVAPVKKQNHNEVWQRALDIMGLEPLNSTTNSPSSSAPHTMAIPTPGPAEGSGKKKSILDLPSETKKEIFKHASGIDLITLSLVCKQFRDLAAQQLYRSFYIIFPDDDDTSSDSPIDVLAAGLDTFVTSEYDYAKYLKEIVLEPLLGGDKGERAYRHYMYDVSCGKFMNTLFLLTLRKARALETFRWDIRVEISRLVFKALHEIEALQHLHLRMQAGHSVYQCPPAINSPSASNGVHAVGQPIPNSLPPPPGPPPGFGPPSHNAPPVPSASSNSFPVGNKYASKLHSKASKALLPPIRKQPPTLSGFQHLRTLEILDMDTLDYVGELRTCIQNCSSTLTTLKMSFSESLAQKSRKPPPEVHSDDNSDTEDEFGQLIPPGPPPPGMGSSSTDPAAPSKALKAQEEKKKQEDVLQRIFGILPPKKSTKPVSSAKPETETKAKSEEDPKTRFIKNLAPVAAKLMSHVKPGADLTAECKKVLDMIENAAKMYTESAEPSKEKSLQTTSEAESVDPTPATSTTSADGLIDEDTIMSGGSADEPGLFDKAEGKKPVASSDPAVSNPDDIDIEEPEASDLAVDLDVSAPDNSVPEDASPESNTLGESSNSKPNTVETQDGPDYSTPGPSGVDWITRQQLVEQAAAIRASHTEIQQEGRLLKQKMEELREKMLNTEPTATDFEALAAAEAEFKHVSDRVALLSRSMQELNEQVDEVGVEARSLALQKTPGNEKAKMSDYIRKTRGLTLSTLAIYLIPIKVNILSKAVDFSVLQNITLLNVGPQTAFWNEMAKKNTLSPLPLSKIYTDNVTPHFLAFASQLNQVTELLLLEKQKGRVESTAAKTTVTTDQIRKLVLKKHASTLKVLMLKNDSSNDWDLNVKTIMLLCHRAKNLEELAASISNRIVHTLLQFMPGMTSLRALHTIAFRTDDTCLWVMREFRKFTVDNVSHNPEMKLEYLALDQYVDRLVRRSKAYASAKKAADKKGKGKGPDNAKALAEMVLGPGGTWPDGGVISGSGSSITAGPLVDWQASSDEEDSGVIVGKMGLKVEAVEGIRFCDIVGVRIFERDVMGGATMKTKNVSTDSANFVTWGMDVL